MTIQPDRNGRNTHSAKKDQRSRRDDVQGEIQDRELQLADLRAQQLQLQASLANLRIELVIIDSTTDSGLPVAPEDKVRLFRSLFRGREDIYPVRFESKKTGKSGYAPACANKFVRGLCDLPKVKCGACKNHAFLPVDDEAMLGHLQGRHVMGVYPMLANETCWLLAVDFDKGAWKDDVAAFCATCRHFEVPVLVERSRSGNGAHVWFFFATPVAAATARRLGCHLLTETMATRHQLGMDSYDRLFPSQDTMPKGGFGNLIALPLQHGPRQHGNSVFLDDDLNPLPDEQQWERLASVKRIPPAVVERIVAYASRDGSLLGLRSADRDIEARSSSPSLRRHGPRPMPGLAGPLPSEVRVVIAERVRIETRDLPPALLNQIKRLAAFQNPEFYKRQSLRLSTAATARVIVCSEEIDGCLFLPRGCQQSLAGLLAEHGVRVEVEDLRGTGTPMDLHFHGELTPSQQRAVTALLAHDIGVFVAPPGSGKTVVGCHMIAARCTSTLVLVHRSPLVDQWRAQMALFLGLDVKEIGQVGAGKRAPNGRLDVAMIQSLLPSVPT